MKKKPILKHLNFAMQAAWWVMIVLLALLLVTIIGAKIKGKVPKVFGYSIIHIISNSMEPTIAENSYILIKEVDASDVKKRDIICFYSPDPAIYGRPNTHRVISDPLVTEGSVTFETQGDNCVAPDAIPVDGERLIGIYVKDLSLLSAFSKALDGGLSFVLLIIVQIGVITVAVITMVTARKTKEETKEENKEEK